MKSLTKQWLGQANYDLATAEAMFKTRRYLYVAFMCQQAIEKLLKAIIQERTGKTPPYTHRLLTLLKLVEIPADAARVDFLELLTAYYINGRYPEHKQKLAKELTKARVQGFLSKTKEVFRWLKNASGI